MPTKNNYEKYKEYYHSDHYKEIKLRDKLKSRYGITLEEYEKLNIKQNNLCAICKNVCNIHKRLCVDHNHKTGKIRGLLCQRCNTGLGKFQDNILLLESALRYLKGDN